MENSVKISRYIILALIIAGVFLYYSIELINMQIVEGSEYLDQVTVSNSSTSLVKAARGEIVDRYGRPIVQNRMGYSVVINRNYLDLDNINGIILQLTRLMPEGEEWVDELPLDISPEGIVSFSEDATETEINRMFSLLKLQKYATPQNCLDAMLEEFELGNVVTRDTRAIIGVRYQMLAEEFSNSNNYTFAEDVSSETVQRILEASNIIKGVEIEEVPYREYACGDLAAHLIGTVGPIYAEEYAELKDSGYSINDTIGKSGVEKEFESYLKGVNGKIKVSRDADGNVVSTEEVVAAQTGNTMVLTLDLDLQRCAQESLAACIDAISRTGGVGTGIDCNAGAAVVLNCRTGEVLAAATYPYYDLETYKEDYSSLLENEAGPLFNRALNGLYPPGSTFKPIIALAALQERVLSTSDEITCTRWYTVDEFSVKCLNYHGPVDMKTALTVSCNYFFYESGRRLTINKMNDYSRRVGLGSKTGIGLGESAGTLAGREERTASGVGSWVIADTLQAAIGQSDNLFTPIQLANYMSTIANGGYRYETTIVKTVKSYGLDETVVPDIADNPKLLNTLNVEVAAVNYVKNALKSVTTEGTARSVFGGYPLSVGGKTGTAEISGSDTGLFIAFAPYNNPEIAIAIIGEHAVHGSWMAPVAKDIFDQYFFGEKTQGENANASGVLLQ